MSNIARQVSSPLLLDCPLCVWHFTVSFLQVNPIPDILFHLKDNSVSTVLSVPLNQLVFIMQTLMIGVIQS